MTPTIIRDIKARKILDSRGNWSIEVDVITNGGVGRARAPSGASKGRHEVVDYPEGSVNIAIKKLENILAPKLLGMDSKEQEEIDSALKEADGTENFSVIGGNTATAISLANSRAAASSLALPLYRYLAGDSSITVPYPLGNIIGGGFHAKNSTDIQEFLICPVGANNIEGAVFANSEIHKKVRKKINRESTYGKGDEGAWALDLKNDEALEILSRASEDVGDELKIKTALGLDVAASEMWDENKEKYVYEKDGKELRSEEQVEYMEDLINRYDLFYVEDPLHEEDFDSFAELTGRVDCLICGDDLYVTNSNRIKRGIKKGSTNAVLIKPNQCGTLTDTRKAIEVVKENNLVPVISHRSGETNDNAIAHIAVGLGCPIIKTGVVGGERTAKLNELIRIMEESPGAKMAELPGFKSG